MDNKLYIDCAHVGHGDCTIITLDGDEKWSCIIDAGDGNTTAYKNIKEVIDIRHIDKFNLAILSHFDKDHIGGYNQLVKDIKIDRYWSPYTPAMEKYKWLFGERGKKAVEVAKILENQLFDVGTFLESPTEGYVFSPVKGLRVTTLSPPIKLYRALFMENADSNVLQDFDTLLGRIIVEGSINSEEEIPREARSMYNRYINGIIIRNIKEENEMQPKTNSHSTITEPDFFGNRALNNTSLVIKIEVWTGCQWYSLLFPGDLENWLYLLAVRPDSINANFYKASHHAGKLYITGKKDATHEVMQTIKPNITLISANGQHGLPNSSTKYALEKWGSSIFCTQTKQNECFCVNGEKFINDDCCCKTHECIQQGKSTSFVIHNCRISINKQACFENLGYSTYPVIQMEQHLITDSKLLMNLTEAEIDKQTNWLLKILSCIHQDREKDKDISSSELISVNSIHRYAVRDDRNLTEGQIENIFEYGHSKNKLWMIIPNTYKAGKYIYKKATKEELDKMCKLILRYDVLIASIPSLQKGIGTLLLEIPAIRLFNLLEEETAFPDEIIEHYCWPKILKEIGEKYTYHCIEVKKDYGNYYRLFLIMCKRAPSFQKVKEQYFNDLKDYYFVKNALQGNENLFFCSNLTQDKYSAKDEYELNEILNIMGSDCSHQEIYDWEYK